MEAQGNGSDRHELEGPGKESGRYPTVSVSTFATGREDFSKSTSWDGSEARTERSSGSQLKVDLHDGKVLRTLSDADSEHFCERNLIDPVVLASRCIPMDALNSFLRPVVLCQCAALSLVKRAAAISRGFHTPSLVSPPPHNFPFLAYHSHSNPQGPGGPHRGQNVTLPATPHGPADTFTSRHRERQRRPWRRGSAEFRAACACAVLIRRPGSAGAARGVAAALLVGLARPSALRIHVCGCRRRRS